MKNRIFSLVILASLVAAPAIAYERDKSDREDQFAIDLQIHSVPDRYTFQDYLSDLTESTRIADIDAKNPVRQLEARKNPKYQPLNPIVIRW
ncbi:MAG: hypothetical protein E6J89_00865 [Deltaproteobacteria bacterium]|nr:MAG: hypothetical protein E6J89_00865 [Deltaproteobacteria bacterium]